MRDTDVQYHFKIPSLGITDKDFVGFNFGRRIEYYRKFDEFKKDPETKTTHISQKRRSFSAALNEFKKLYKPREFFVTNIDRTDYKDDCNRIWYKE